MLDLQESNPQRKENINTWLSQINTDYKAAISVDCVIFGYDKEDLKILLLRSDMPPFEGMFSLLGDLLRPEETLDQSAIRVLEKHTGLNDLFMEQVSAFSEVGRHPLGRVITIAYYSLVKLDERLQEVVHDHPQLQWVSLKTVTDLAFDHKNILNRCSNTLRHRLREKPIGFELLPKKFSLKQLQNLYEKVLDIELDKRNFRRKLKSLDVLIDVNEHQTDVNHRPAKLYMFDKTAYDMKRKTGFAFEL